MVFPELRAHQTAALSAFEQNRDASRFHFVLPPGAGKTLLGSVIAQQVARRLVVLVPNTAIAAQWMDLWRHAAVNPDVTVDAPTVGSDRRLDCDVTVLTYQAVATFDDEAENRRGRDMIFDDDVVEERRYRSPDEAAEAE